MIVRLHYETAPPKIAAQRASTSPTTTSKSTFRLQLAFTLQGNSPLPVTAQCRDKITQIDLVKGPDDTAQSSGRDR